MNVFGKQMLTKITFFLMIFCCFASKSEALNWSEDQRLQIDSVGNVVAIWQSYDAINSVYIIQSSYYDAALATWSAISTISDTAVSSFSPEFAMNTNGDSVAIWISDDYNGTLGIFASIRPAAGNFPGTATLVSDSSDLAILNDYRVVLNDAGDIAISWTAFIDFTYTAVIRTAIGDISNTWAPVTLSN